MPLYIVIYNSNMLLGVFSSPDTLNKTLEKHANTLSDDFVVYQLTSDASYANVPIEIK